MEPHNAVRHEVGVDQYGIYKVDALAHRLLCMNPGIYNNVEVIRNAVGNVTPIEDEEKLYNLIASSDLVIDTTGVHWVSRYINDVCYDLEIPTLYASVTNGAWGGEIVRVIPGKTACWNCWYRHYETQRPSAAPAPKAGIFAPGCDQPTFTGTTFEVGIVANLATWMATEVLLRAEPDRQDFAGDYIRWSARDASGCPQPLTEILPIQQRSNCPLCQPT